MYNTLCGRIKTIRPPKRPKKKICYPFNKIVDHIRLEMSARLFWDSMSLLWLQAMIHCTFVMKSDEISKTIRPGFLASPMGLKKEFFFSRPELRNVQNENSKIVPSVSNLFASAV